jgi:hypothetical protein
MKHGKDNDHWTGISVLLIENTFLQFYCIYSRSVLMAWQSGCLWGERQEGVLHKYKGC